MLEARWGRRLGPGVAALAGILAIATTTIGAPTVEGRPPPDCADHAATGSASVGSPWFRLTPLLVDGARNGQRLEIGRGRLWTMALASESFATGPHAGRVVVGNDDGRRSTVSTVDTARGCREHIATSSDHVIRNAVLSADGTQLYEFRVRRSDRADLGVWRRVAGEAQAERILPPVEADAAFGRTWATTLHWATDGRRLVVSSCGEVACRFRILDPADGRVETVADPSHGSLLGLDGDDLLLRAACRGLPCAVLQVDVPTGRTTVVDAAAGAVALSSDPDRGPALVADDRDIGGGLRRLAIDGRASTAWHSGSDDRLMVPGPDSGVELPPGWIALDGPDGLLARSVVDAVTRPLEEVRP
jgi:hypothetical protein